MKSRRKLFCEISPLTYKISVLKCRIIRSIKDFFSSSTFAKERQKEPLPYLICRHNSLIRRKLGNVDSVLQNNKAVNLGIAAPKISCILIKPGEVFSFWRLVGSCPKRKVYKEGLVIAGGQTDQNIGGGMCQFTNLIHWMVLHTPMQLTEHHHHDEWDLFPDFGRQVPFGTGTSIMYNYLDYRFKNTTAMTFQLIVYVTEEYLCGELRASAPLDVKYHIKAANEYFYKQDDVVYRHNEIYRECVDKKTGNLLGTELLKTNDAKVMYDEQDIPADQFREP